MMRYLDEGKSLRFAAIEGISFLRYCIAMIDEELAIEIVKRGIDLDINEPWDNGQTPLHFACQMDLIELIEAILTERANEVDFYAVTDDFLVQFNDFQPGGKTVLHYAAMNGALEVCKLLLHFERTVLDRNELIFTVDLQGNDPIDDALIHRKVEVARYLRSYSRSYSRSNLLSVQNTEIQQKSAKTTKSRNSEIESIDEINQWIKQRESQLNGKRVADSKATRIRYERRNAELVESEEDQMNRVFVIRNLWNEQQCAAILETVIRFGDANGWTSQRHRSYATTDIPSHMIGAEMDENLRKLLSQKLYPQIIDKYRLNERFGINVDEGERVEIGVRDLFFVRYDLLRQNELKLHRDGSLVSFNILLNDRSDFEGGGTYFEHLNKVIGIERGDCVIHSGKVLHAGHPITSGERYILVGFLDGKVRRRPTQMTSRGEENRDPNCRECSFHAVKSF